MLFPPGVVVQETKNKGRDKARRVADLNTDTAVSPGMKYE
jgi:hypothetical protein